MRSAQAVLGVPDEGARCGLATEGSAGALDAGASDDYGAVGGGCVGGRSGPRRREGLPGRPFRPASSGTPPTGIQRTAIERLSPTMTDPSALAAYASAKGSYARGDTEVPDSDHASGLRPEKRLRSAVGDGRADDRCAIGADAVAGSAESPPGEVAQAEERRSRNGVSEWLGAVVRFALTGDNGAVAR